MNVFVITKIAGISLIGIDYILTTRQKTSEIKWVVRGQNKKRFTGRERADKSEQIYLTSNIKNSSIAKHTSPPLQFIW